jgi:hypothetical protein
VPPLLDRNRWHHEPTPWACSVLWALDDFTPENGGTSEC